MDAIADSDQQSSRAGGARRVTFRVYDKSSADANELDRHLKSRLARDPLLRPDIESVAILSVAAHGQNLCATVSITTAAPVERVCQHLACRVGPRSSHHYIDNFEGITTLFNAGDNADIDVIAVPGFAEHALGSWASPISDQVWLRDFLPKDVPRIRVLLYGYHDEAKTSIERLSRALVSEIAEYRKRDRTSSRPIVFIGHSLGGLVIKQALSTASTIRHSVLFFGVPVLGLRHDQLVTIFPQIPDATLADGLLLDSQSETPLFMKSLEETFHRYLTGQRVVFYETKPSTVLQMKKYRILQETGTSTLLVSTESATWSSCGNENEIACDTDHSGLVKYDSAADPHYKIVRERIRRLAIDAKNVTTESSGPGTHEPRQKTEYDAGRIEACLRKLAFPGMHSGRSNVPDAFPGTYTWFPSHPTVKQWMNQHRGLLTIQGKIGSGKSVLMKHAEQHIKYHASPETLVLSFSFNQHGFALQRNRLGLLRCILHGLLSRVPTASFELLDHFQTKQEPATKTQGHHEWDVPLLQNFLETSLPRVLALFPVVILLDGIDECDQEDASEVVRDSERLLFNLPPTTHSLSICVSHRHRPDLQATRYTLGLNLEEETEADIIAYIQGHGIGMEICNAIVSRAEGFFLWVRLIVERIHFMMITETGPSTAIWAEIKRVPRGLNSLYRQILYRHDLHPCAHPLALARWLCFSTEPLTIGELQWALAVDPDGAQGSLDECRQGKSFIADEDIPESIADFGGGLAQIVANSEARVVQLIHRTVKDFLLQDGLRILSESPENQITAGHFWLAQCCIHYIRMVLVRQPGSLDRQDLSRYPFLRYAVASWAHHLKLSGNLVEICSDKLLDSLGWSSKPLFQSWKHMYRVLEPSARDDPSSLIHFAAKHDLGKLVVCLVRKAGVDFNVEDIDGRTALSWAAAEGHRITAELLLDTGEVDPNSRDMDGRTPLSLASEKGHRTVVELLLQMSIIDCEAKDHSGRTALSWAAERGHRTVVELLLKTTVIDYEASDDYSRTPILWATENGHGEIASLIRATQDRRLQPAGPPKGSVRDSGYASASGPMSLVSGPSPREGISALAADFPDEVDQAYEHDLQSIISDDESIGSQASDEITAQGRIGKDLIREFLSEEPQFRALCDKAIVKMTKQRTVENLRRLLKSFYKRLLGEAEGKAEKATAELLRSRRGRARISDELVNGIHLRVIPEEKQHIETWLAMISGGPVDVQDASGSGAGGDEIEVTLSGASLSNFDIEDDEDQDNENTGSEGGRSDSKEQEDYPQIFEMKSFLRGTNSFQHLLRSFTSIFLPAELSQVLQTVPKENFWLSHEQDLSVENRVKSWVEDNMQVRWTWWPFEARKRMLRDGESRLFWKCACGVRQWQEISAEHRELIQKLLALPSDERQLPHECRTKRAKWTPWHRGMFRKVPSAQAAIGTAAAQKHTSSGNNASSALPTGSGSAPPGGGIPNKTIPSQPSRLADPTTAHRARPKKPNLVNQNQRWILFGVQSARQTLTPVQIQVNDQSTDFGVYQELRTLYHAHRGQLKRLFSIWRLANCQVVQFDRMTAERLIRMNEGLPANADYEYSPRAGQPEATNPPISDHAFSVLFYTCKAPCSWPLQLFHDCFEPPPGVRYLQQIPKRTRCFQTQQNSPVWGFDGVFVVSFFYVFIYHCVIMLGPFIFFWVWIGLHPGELQDASVPATVVLACLSCFWAGSGLLPARGPVDKSRS